MRFTSVAVAVLIIGSMLGSCGGNTTGRRLALVPAPAHERALADVTAEWLRTQPGIQLDEFSFHLLDSARQPMADWQGLAVEKSPGASLSFDLTCSNSAPDDIFLYIVYPPEQYICQEAKLASSCSDEFIFLAMPHREPGVLVVGLSRIGPRRSTALSSRDLAHFEFASGQEPVRRSLSQVNTDPKSAVELTAFYENEGGVVALYWDERNTGDYNNNSLVEISDITPLGFYYDQEVQAADEPQKLLIVDGNNDGWITINDLTQIGANWQRRIEGYKIYMATVANPGLADFTEVVPWEPATVIRADVFAATIEAKRDERLGYITEVDNPATAELHFMVRAFSADGDETTLGPPSNIATPPLPSNNPPVWVSTAGLIQTVGYSDGIRITFGRAVDPDGDTVEYILRYVEAGQPIGTPGTVVLVMPAEVVAGDPPYTYRIDGLIRGETYSLLMRARDEHGLEDANGNTMHAKIPALGVSHDTWPYHRCDPGRTGCSPESPLKEPLTEAWSTELGWPTDEVRANEPVISANGWVGVADNAGDFRRYLLDDGLELPAEPCFTTGSPFRGALSGDLLGFGRPDRLDVVRLGGSSWAWTLIGQVEGGPLILGDLVFAAGSQGVLGAEIDLGATWTFKPEPAVSYSLSPAADTEFLYVVRDDGRMDKLDLLTGANTATGQLSAPPVGDSFALDALNNRLYVATEDDFLVEVAIGTPDMSVSNSWPAAENDRNWTAPCLVLYADPPLAVFGHKYVSMIESPAIVRAINLADGSDAWTVPVRFPFFPAHVTANAERIFVLSADGNLAVFDFAGNLRQMLDMPWPVHSAAVLGEGHLAAVSGSGLQVFEQAATDNPPAWVSTEGVTSLDTADGSITAHWGDAVDEYGEVVSYAVYYSIHKNLVFDPPGWSTVITGIDESARSHTITGLDNDTRYWVAVRAYDGVWGVDENLELNTVMLPATPPWQREELILGDDLPAGEVYFMRGLVDPAGTMHLIYNDEADTHLTHVWGDTGNWQYEGTGLAEHSAIAFEPAWDASNGRLALGWATSTEVGVLVRTGENTWSKTRFPDTLPGINPQVSLAIGDEWALAYTHDMWGGPVENEVDYYLKRTVGSVWQSYEPLEETNLSGRDIDLVIDPGDSLTPWAVMQRGGESTPNRHTPEEGECMYAWWNDGASSWDYDTIDAGDNAPDSDCGKRVQQVLDDDGNPHLAYLDLDANADHPRGKMKYAYHDGVAWHVETVSSFSLHFQTGSLQYTWGELGFALIDDGLGGQQPLIANLYRTGGSSPGEPHWMQAHICWRDGVDGWEIIPLTDGEWVFPRDREPCVLLVTPDGVWHVFYVTAQDQDEPTAADSLVHLWRPVL